jgi:hypothetical protein
MEVTLNWFKLLANKKYSIIYANPPWEYTGTFKSSAGKHYKMMDLDNFCKIPAKQLTDKTCALLM